MNGSKKKYLTDFAVNLCSSRWMMTTASQLTSGGYMNPLEKNIADNCHIYLICKMPIFSFCASTFKYENDTISGSVLSRKNGGERSYPFKFDFPLLDGATNVQLSPYPHREVITTDQSGKIIRRLPASTVCIGLGFHISNPELSSLEVLYVGQAFGDGSRSAFDRLQSHSTLQKILADVHYSDPENEVYVLAFEYESYRVISMMNGVHDPEISDHRDTARFYSIKDNPLTEHQQVCLTEAALIRYFQPRYNAIYKDSFPSPKHKILESCYELDFSALIVEINTDELCFSLFSDKVPPQSHHICSMDLISHLDRWGFFHYSTTDGGVNKFPNVIASA